MLTGLYPTAPAGLGGYGQLEDLALQPSVLQLDPVHARAQFVADLDRLHRTGAGLRDLADQRARADYQRAQAGVPKPYQKPYRPKVADATQYMVAAIMRDAALDDYDRRTRAR